MRIRFCSSFCQCFLAVIVCVLCAESAISENTAATIERVGNDIEYLASDELEGRGPMTKGLQLAADYIRDEFKASGLVSGTEDGSFMQPFEIRVGTEPVLAKTMLVLRGPDGKEMKLEVGEQFQPMAAGGEGSVTAEVVFVGYGISAEEQNYDDYKDIDVKDKVVVMIRREPQQDDEESVFNGKNITSHSYIRTKLEAAKKSEAAAILMVNDPFSTSENDKDELSKPDGFGTNGADMPMAHMKQDIANQLLSVSPLELADGKELTTVAGIEDAIDETLEPISQPIDGWTAELNFAFESIEANVGNVVGVLEGEGPLADETIVIGAHYDHLGYGPFGSRRPGEKAVHNGADDNATGTAAVIELARRFAERDNKPARRMVFVGFTGEERGLLGSNYYIGNPLIPLENTVAMINFDMIGNLSEQGLQLGGVRTGKEFPGLVEKVVDASAMKVNTSMAMGGSDHAGFYRKGIPVVFFHTGLTDLYHTPDDDFETINVDGVVKTIDFAEQFLDELVNMPERPEHVEGVGRRPSRRGPMAYLGIVPDYSATEEGLVLAEVNEDGPASEAGLQSGDIITKIGETSVADIQGLSAGLRKHRPGEKVEIAVKRGEEELTIEVTLGRPPRRTGR
ncbi:MAG: M20/M25/M40 family metallo-hydrolase [Planctomycetota bacterium]